MTATTLIDARRIEPTILREYDIRGIVGKTLTEDDMRALGRAFGTLVVHDGGRRVAVGYDGRLSSPVLQQALAEGIAASGADVLRIGQGPSPMLYFACHHLGVDGGMMVTGSHNPPNYNGLKMTKGGKPFFGPDIQTLAAIAAAGDFTSGVGVIEDVPVIDDYVDRLLQDLEMPRPLTVAWDPGNGAVGDVLAKLVARMPGKHIVINGEVDGTFPNHHPDPTVEKNLEDLREAVALDHCDLGIAFDGDGDRIGIIDSLGRVIWGDQLLVILAGPILAEIPGATIIADVKSSEVFFSEIARMGGNAVMGRTGHSLIKKQMAETGAPLAGEMSGHIFFAHRYYGFDDALYAAIRLLSILGQSERSLADMRDALPKMVNTPELRISCSEERKFAVVEEVKRRLTGVDGIRVHDVDGVRVTTEDGWWLLRASNTQPVLVGRCEAADQPALERLITELHQQLTLAGVDPTLEEE